MMTTKQFSIMYINMILLTLIAEYVLLIIRCFFDSDKETLLRCVFSDKQVSSNSIQLAHHQSNKYKSKPASITFKIYTFPSHAMLAKRNMSFHDLDMYHTFCYS